MNVRKSAEPSPAAIARADRQRLAAEESERAMGDVERQATEVRANMARLRGLREAKEVADTALAATLPPPVTRKRKRKSPR